MSILRETSCIFVDWIVLALHSHTFTIALLAVLYLKSYEHENPLHRFLKNIQFKEFHVNAVRAPLVLETD